ncbi:MAG: alkaline phosphatase family protein [Rhodospirillaceae bacterium]
MPTKRAILVICDGLRADMIRPDWTPNLWRIKERGRFYANHRSVYPSTTRTTAASIATGCHPARHGLEGNAIALDLGEGLEVFSVGPPGFREKLEKARGRTLKTPTLAERLKAEGGVEIWSNVSPGAAMFHDPDGHGHIYHRSFSQGPGRAALPPTGMSHDAAGDTALTDKFLADVLGPADSGPVFAVLWQCEPDHTQHAVALGSPEHLEVLANADMNAGRVADRIAELDPSGENILLICASDHGHETVTETVDLDAMLIAAGLKDGVGNRDVVVASQGLSATVYLSDAALEREGAIVDFLRNDPRFGGVVSGADLALVGMPVDEGPRIAVMGASTEDENDFGVPGCSVAVQGTLKISINDGCGQHGGMGRFEQNPFALAVGGGHRAGSECLDPTSAVDLAPTILKHLGQPHDDMDGAPLH